MGSATRSALAGARDALASTKGIDLAGGAELLAAGRAIGASPQLLSAFGDPASGPEAKRQLVESLFGGVRPAVRALLSAILERRWSSGDDLLAGIEELGISAIAEAAPKSASVPNELLDFGRAVGANPELELAIASKRENNESKVRLVETLLSSASPATQAIAAHLVQQQRGRRISELVRTGASIVADAAGKGIATVSVAKPLSNPQRTAIEAGLARRFGRDHVIDQIIDPSLIGGVRVQVGHEVIDASVQARLTQLKLALAS